MPANPGLIPALDHHDGTRLVDVQNRHSVNRARGVGTCRGIGDVVGADHERDVRLREIAVDLVHVKQPVVGDVGLGQEDVHVAGHSAGDRVDAELDVDPGLVSKS